MGKLKDHLIGLEDTFWSQANTVITGCEVVEDFVSEMSEYRDYLPLIDDAEFTEVLVDAWSDYWLGKG